MAEHVNGGDLSRLRRLNALTTLRALRGGSALTVSELAKLTRLSRPSVEDVVADLVAHGWVAEAAPVAGAMGRPARRYRFRADLGYVLGVDVGAHKVLATFADLDGSVLARARVAVTPDLPRPRRLGAIDTAIADCLSVAGRGPGDLWAAAVATTGLVDQRGIVTLATGIPDWMGVDLAAHLRTTLPCPVQVENDCKLAALAEGWRGAAQGADDVVYLLLGLRTGAGLIIGGRPHRGFSGAAGEIGMLPESRWAVAQESLNRWADAPPGTPADGIAPLVFAAARAGQASAQAAVDRYVSDIAVGTAALVLALDPELVVLGGGFSRSADLLLEPLHRELERRCVRTPRVVSSALGDEAPAFGAVRLALDAVEREVFAADAGPAIPAPPARAV